MADLDTSVQTERAIKQVRHASKNLEQSQRHYSYFHPSAKAAKLLTVFANSMAFAGPANRGQVEAALADYFDSLEG